MSELHPYIGPELLRETQIIVGSTLCSETVTLSPYDHKQGQDLYGAIAIQRAMEQIPGDLAYKYAAVQPYLPAILELAGGEVKIYTEQLGFRQGCSIEVAGETRSITYKPYCLLLDLALHPDMIRSATELLESVWGKSMPSGLGTEDVKYRTLNLIDANMKRAKDALGPVFGHSKTGAVRHLRRCGYMGVSERIRPESS